MTTTPRPRAPRPQMILEVIRSSWVTPHLVRLTLGGPGFADFQPKDATDSYVKISFAKPELGLEPPYDLAALRETLAPADLPVTRTYTVRRVDQAAGTLDIDFVVHGDEGIAGPWAAAAQPGDRAGARRPRRRLPARPDSRLAPSSRATSGRSPRSPRPLEALPGRMRKGSRSSDRSGRDDLVDLDPPGRGCQLIWVGTCGPRRIRRPRSSPTAISETPVARRTRAGLRPRRA